MIDVLMTIPDFVRLETAIKSEARAYQMIKEDLIPVTRIGRRVYIDPVRWEQFKRSGGKGRAADGGQPVESPRQEKPRRKKKQRARAHRAGR